MVGTDTYILIMPGKISNANYFQFPKINFKLLLLNEIKKFKLLKNTACLQWKQKK